MIESLSLSFNKIKNERDLLLSKSGSTNIDIKSILDNNQDSRPNLIAHKQLINELIGQLNSIKDLYTASVRRENETNSFLDDFVFDVETMRADQDLLKSIKKVKIEPLIKEQKERDEKQKLHSYGKLSTSQKVLQLNIDRYLIALEKNNRWELEKDAIEVDFRRCL